jgi:NADH:ubiquinone oxidoreductase subunit B-like Fe-S oxidoreductase
VGDPPIPNWIRRLDALINWARRNSIRVMPFNTACCGIEFMAAFASKYDLARFWNGVARIQSEASGSSLSTCTYPVVPPDRRI